MKKGQRRKDGKRKNRHGRHFITPEGVKAKGRKNPAFGLLDQKAMRQMFNHAIGSLLIGALDIDFIGILEERAVEDESRAPETIQ